MERCACGGEKPRSSPTLIVIAGGGERGKDAAPVAVGVGVGLVV